MGAQMASLGSFRGHWSQGGLGLGIPWCVQWLGQVLLLLGARVQSLVREIRSCKLQGVAKNKIKAIDT